ncbi:DNA adenine methylase [Clostridium perfringens]
MNINNAKPFVKWAGGKRNLLNQFQELYPDNLNNIDTYIEPFVGGGAVFFELANKYKFKKIILNDINTTLVNTYTSIRDNVEQLIEILKVLQEKYNLCNETERSELYYEIREKFNISKLDPESNKLKESAYFLFLNKTCFNGLYRENKKGLFNVPFGKYKNPSILDENNLRNSNKLLQNVEILNIDFANLNKYINKNTFIYIDPPYRPLNQTSSFNSYSKIEFDDDEQRRLAKWFAEANNLGAKLMLSNSNPKNINENDDFFDILYKDFNLFTVLANRSINSKASKRGAISEIVVVNYKVEQIALK